MFESQNDIITHYQRKLLGWGKKRANLQIDLDQHTGQQNVDKQFIKVSPAFSSFLTNQGFRQIEISTPDKRRTVRIWPLRNLGRPLFYFLYLFSTSERSTFPFSPRRERYIPKWETRNTLKTVRSPRRVIRHPTKTAKSIFGTTFSNSFGKRKHVRSYTNRRWSRPHLREKQL